MTLTPTLGPVHGVKGKPVVRNVVCAVPGCEELSAHGHHIFPRSYLRGQPQDWVMLPDGAVISNVIGLCFRHHEWVTGVPGYGHRARLDWFDGDLAWVEIDRQTGELDWVGPLDPQPLVHRDREEEEAASPPPSDPSPRERHVQAAVARLHKTLAPGETCAACGYTKPIPREPGPQRPAITWGVQVPRDAEIGAEVLDEWIAQFAAIMGLEGTKGLVRYHVLALVLAWADQNLPQFIHDVKEAGDG